MYTVRKKKGKGGKKGKAGEKKKRERDRGKKKELPLSFRYFLKEKSFGKDYLGFFPL